MYFDRHNIDKEPAKISVILGARNEEKYISKSLDSRLQQDYPNFEIIVIDDSSSDSTCDIIRKYQKKL